jgi:hypothetical protein
MISLAGEPPQSFVERIVRSWECGPGFEAHVALAVEKPRWVAYVATVSFHAGRSARRAWFFERATGCVIEPAIIDMAALVKRLPPGCSREPTVIPNEDGLLVMARGVSVAIPWHELRGIVAPQLEAGELTSPGARWPLR